jgi:hypothetical protein
VLLFDGSKRTLYMIRLTVLYNLTPGSDEDAFLEWRLGEHQKDNASMPYVVRTDFGRVDEAWTPADSAAKPPYRFMTVMEWPDRAAYEASFLEEGAQAKLREDIKRLSDPIFLVSEILINETLEASA